MAPDIYSSHFELFVKRMKGKIRLKIMTIEAKDRNEWLRRKV